MAKPNSRKRRALRALEDFPGLFDVADMDMPGSSDGVSAAPASADRAGSGAPAPASAAHSAAGAEGNTFDIDTGKLRHHNSLRFISFGSGSSGNCAYLGNDSGGILIDAGVDSDLVVKTLQDNHIDMRSVAGIVLTHDHGDHMRYAYRLLRYNRHMALFCTPRCLQGLLRRTSMSRRVKDYHRAIYKEIEFEAAGFAITPFETSHDGSDNVGYSIRHNDCTFVVATDMGMITERADHYMRRANFIMLEADYDAEMLRSCDRPDYLKARIAGPKGHLDNVVTASWAASVLESARTRDDILSHIFLCHISKDTNTPALAVGAVADAIAALGLKTGDATMSAEMTDARVQLAALPRLEPSPVYMLRRVTRKHNGDDSPAQQ